MKLKDVFGEVESDGADLVHGRLLEWALTPPLWHAEAVGGVHTIRARCLKERSPSVKDIILDMDTLTVSKASTKIEDTPVRTMIMGEVYLERKETEKSQQFLCLIGEKGKVLLTFFTTR